MEILGFKIEKHDVKALHRIPTYKIEGPKPVIISFVSSMLRDEILSVYYSRKKPISGEELGYGKASKVTVFVATHLTPEMKLLFKQARDLKKLGVQYVWERYGSIFTKINDTLPKTKILCNADLEEVKKNIPLKKQLPT